MAPVGYIEVGHGQSTFRPIRESRSFLPFVVGAAALLMLLPRLLGRRTSYGRKIWRGLRR